MIIAVDSTGSNLYIAHSHMPFVESHIHAGGCRETKFNESASLNSFVEYRYRINHIKP